MIDNRHGRRISVFKKSLTPRSARGLGRGIPATVADPGKGGLPEIGFMAGSAVSPVDPATCRSYFIRQPEGQFISAHVLKITGISDPDLDRGITDSEVCYMLFEAGCDVAARNSSSRLIKSFEWPSIDGILFSYRRFIKPYDI